MKLKCLLFLTLFLGFSYGQQHIDGVAAVVGDEIILLSDVSTMINQYSFQNRVNVYNDPGLRKKLTNTFLQRMIDEKLLLIKADEDTIQADQERVDQILEQQIAQFTQQVGSQEALEKYYGMPISRIKKELRTQISNRLRIEQLRGSRSIKTKISRREVEAFYQSYRDSLPEVKESVDISHILLKISPSDEGINTAFVRIEEVKKKLDEGGNFIELAKEFSEDPSAQYNNGNLGLVSRGDLVKEFEEVAFALEKGEISDIVQTQFGLHIIRLNERQGEKIDVSHILIRVQPTDGDAENTRQQLQAIRQKVLEGEISFTEAALANSEDPNVQQDNGNLGRFELDRFQIPAFAEAARNLSSGEISEPFVTDFGMHILRVNERIQPHKLNLEDDWQRVQQFAMEYKIGKEFDTWIKALREEIPIKIKMEI